MSRPVIGYLVIDGIGVIRHALMPTWGLLTVEDCLTNARIIAGGGPDLTVREVLLGAEIPTHG